jgi:hypothetical protein
MISSEVVFASCACIGKAGRVCSCPAVTIPVYRAAPEQTGSHRFITIQSAITEVLARGWTNEGVAFCAPQ